MFLLIDKPKGITSHDVIYQVRRITGERKVGHAGTLDPNATGLLIVAVGRGSTKKLGNITKGTNKVYEASIILGEERDTGDIEGKIVFKNTNGEKPSEKEIIELLKKFTGTQKQIPSSFSAVKIKGKKAYELAREGKEVKLSSREVHIYRLDLLSYSYPELKIKAEVSPGTYIRALARDMGRDLRTGAYLKDLRRIAIGDYDILSAVELSELTPDNWQELAVTID